MKFNIAQVMHRKVGKVNRQMIKRNNENKQKAKVKWQTSFKMSILIKNVNF